MAERVAAAGLVRVFCRSHVFAGIRLLSRKELSSARLVMSNTVSLEYLWRNPLHTTNAREVAFLGDEDPAPSL